MGFKYSSKDAQLAAKCQARKSGYGRLCKRVFVGGLCCGKLRVFDLDNDRDFLLLMAQLPIKEQLMILTRDYDSNMNTEP